MGKAAPASLLKVGSRSSVLPILETTPGFTLPGPQITAGTRIFAARKGDYKLYFYRNNPLGYPEKMEKLEPGQYQLFHLQHDPSERYNLADQLPEVMKEIEAMVQQHQKTVVPVPSNLEKRIVQK